MFSIGIDLGGTNIAVGLCNEALEIVDKLSTPTKAERGADAIVADMAMVSKALLERNSISLSEISYVGIAAPGSVNSAEGVIEYSNNIKMENFPMVEKFKRHFPTDRVYIENDANAAALGEALGGAAKGTGSSVMITLGTGVGSGIIMNGKIFSGCINSAGAELGHTVIEFGGRQCTCGRRGCFEAYASASALISMTKEVMTELELKKINSSLFDIASRSGKVSARTAFDAMRAGDPYGKALVDKYIAYLAAGITNIINIFQPEIITIGGGVSNEKETLVAPLREIVSSEQYTRGQAVKAKIAVASLGNDAGIVGAAGLGR